jgi:hypothetical protein
MDALFQQFAEAQAAGHGNNLAQTISPSLSKDKLRAIWKSCNAHDVKNVIRRNIQNSTSGMNRLSQEEVQAWVEIYVSYWKAVGELLAIQEPSIVNGKVSCCVFSIAVSARYHLHLGHYHRGQWQRWGLLLVQMSRILFCSSSDSYDTAVASTLDRCLRGVEGDVVFPDSGLSQCRV